MKRVLFLAVSLLILSSCQVELDQMFVDSEAGASVSGIVFHASTESASLPETRIYADENMKVLWNADDRISIFEKKTYNYQYKFLGEDGETAGDFEKVTTSGFHTGGDVDYYYAAYPYRTSNKLSNSGVLTMVLPAEQYYKENSFGIGSNTMVAVSDGDFLAFKNVCGYLSISLWGDDVSVSKVTIQGRNGEKIAGKASISIPFGGLPETTMDVNTATESITIECNPVLKVGSTSSECTTFWFAIPPVTFSKGLTITIVDDRGGVFTKSASKEIKIERNKLARMGVLNVVPTYAAVSFADENFGAYCVANFDANGDGEITSDEASAVKSIEVCTDNIESLVGVESFTNLESLKCTGSGVVTRSASAYNGQLTSLDVSALTQLKELDCRDNQLETLDVSGNPELETLICTENPMSEIKVAVGQEIPQLECPEDTEIVYEWGEGIGPDRFPDEVFCDYVFVNFDTDGDGFLSDEECNAVTEINVRTDNIESLQGIEFFSNLEKIVAFPTVSGGPLCALDVSNNPALNYLNVTGNQLIGGLDVSNNPELNTLICANCGLTSLDLTKNTKLSQLTCADNQFVEIDISRNPELKSVSVNHNHISALDDSAHISLDMSTSKRVVLLFRYQTYI